MQETKVSIIIPCYNEEGNIGLLYNNILDYIKKYRVEFIFIDDHSMDNTLKVIESLAANDNSIKYISFSRNFGHQNAIRAGLTYATGDCIISMDADLQHPPEVIPKLIAKWKEGYQIVYTIRKDRLRNKNILKTLTSKFFYKILNYLSEIKIEEGSADFRLIDKKVKKVLVSDIKEYHIFYRGIFNWVGFNKIAIEYEPNERHSGVSKYTLKRMLTLAINGITSFSIKPLRLASILGFLISIFAFFYLFFILYIFFFTQKAIQGWTSILVTILLMGGLNMFFLGILGEYLGKIFIQNKNRPPYIIQKTNIVID